ncbi:MAG TPA: hypothetical protein VF092_15760 [Longimicrobium sp.]
MIAKKKDDKNRRIFGPAKYAAFHLLFARWLRHFGSAERYRYVTLGGTELRDVQNLWFIDPNLVTQATSYEIDPVRARIAAETSRKLATADPPIEVQTSRGNLFDYVREDDDLPAILFLDLEGVCAAGDFHIQFASMFQDGRLREDDVLFVTSYLGRNLGWNRIYQGLDAEFRILQLHDAESKKHWYRRAHPSFTLYRGLTRAGVQSELAVRCFGCVEYRDKSPMGLYGYSFAEGSTVFSRLVKEAPYWHVKHGALERPVL